MPPPPLARRRSSASTRPSATYQCYVCKPLARGRRRLPPRHVPDRARSSAAARATTRRREGSGNPGASNVYRTAGARRGRAGPRSATLAKGARRRPRSVSPSAAGPSALACGAAAVRRPRRPASPGRFRGGKGVATAAGMVVVLLPGAGPRSALVCGRRGRLTRKASLASLVMAVAAVVPSRGRPARPRRGHRRGGRRRRRSSSAPCCNIARSRRAPEQRLASPTRGARRTMTTQVRKAVIPAAGLGTRFLPATKAQPKEMLPVVDSPAIQYVVEEAVRAGIDDILIITGRGKRSHRGPLRPQLRARATSSRQKGKTDGPRRRSASSPSWPTSTTSARASRSGLGHAVVRRPQARRRRPVRRHARRRHHGRPRPVCSRR